MPFSLDQLQLVGHIKDSSLDLAFNEKPKKSISGCTLRTQLIIRIFMGLKPKIKKPPNVGINWSAQTRWLIKQVLSGKKDRDY